MKLLKFALTVTKALSCNALLVIGILYVLKFWTRHYLPLQLRVSHQIVCTFPLFLDHSGLMLWCVGMETVKLLQSIREQIVLNVLVGHMLVQMPQI